MVATSTASASTITSATTTTSTNTTATGKVKKSYANPNLWQCNITKRLREMGHSYVASNGRVRSERSLKSPCPSNCIFACQSNFTESERTQILKHFWSLSNLQKNEYMAKFITRMEAKTSRSGKHADKLSRRQYTYVYNLATEKNRYQVCKRFFRSTLDMGEKKIYWYFNHIQSSKR